MDSSESATDSDRMSARIPPVSCGEWRCPGCGGKQFLLMSSRKLITWGKDRVCVDCLEHTPEPPPTWSYPVLRITGVLLILAAGTIIFFEIMNLAALTVAGGLGLTGILMVWFGMTAVSDHGKRLQQNPVFKVISSLVHRFWGQVVVYALLLLICIVVLTVVTLLSN